MHAPSNKKPAREQDHLDLHYRKIGISALAAALPYQSDAKNPAYAPVKARPREDGEDIAA